MGLRLFWNNVAVQRRKFFASAFRTGGTQRPPR